MKDKFILDACCGGRCFWFDKHHENVLYIDNRVRDNGHDAHRPNHTVKPDIVMDFRKLEFPDKSFKLVVMDPPHIKAKGETFRYARKYGWLNPDTWKEDIKRGFDEAWRVLEDYGILIFKWSELSVRKKEVLDVIRKRPLFGHTTTLNKNTIWFTFMKIPEEVTLQQGKEEEKN